MTAFSLPSQIGDIVGLPDALTAKADRTDRLIAPYALMSRPVITTHSLCAFHGVSNGTDTAATYRTRYRAARTAADLALVYGNFRVDVGANPVEQPGANAITLRAALETTDGVFYPVFFGGRRDCVLDPGAVITSDPTGVDVAAGTDFAVRTYVQVVSGGTWCLGLTSDPSRGEGNNRGVGAADTTLGGSVPTAFEFSYAPLAIVGTTKPRQVTSVALFGDSLLAGQGDTAALDRGFGTIACDHLGIGTVKLAVPGDRAQFCAGMGRRLRLELAAGCTHALVEYGINDITSGGTLSLIQSALTDLWNALSRRGLLVWQTTLTPITTSSDGWATTANQTIFARESVRRALNAWIRTVPAPLSGIFETADTVETARDSGLWKPNYTDDGTHPATLGHTAMAEVITFVP